MRQFWFFAPLILSYVLVSLSPGQTSSACPLPAAQTYTLLQTFGTNGQGPNDPQFSGIIAQGRILMSSSCYVYNDAWASGSVSLNNSALVNHDATSASKADGTFLERMNTRAAWLSPAMPATASLITSQQPAASSAPYCRTLPLSARCVTILILARVGQLCLLIGRPK